MKTKLRLAAIATSIAAFVFTVAGSAVEPAKGATRDAMTSADLEAARAKSKVEVRGNALVPADLKPVAPKDEAAEFMASVVFLSDGQSSVMIPKGSLIHLGKLKASVAAPSSDKPLVAWVDFATRNSSWIKELQLTSEQAMGRVKLDPRLLKPMGSDAFVVVSTYCHQPVAAVAAVKDTFQKTLDPKKP